MSRLIGVDDGLVWQGRFEFGIGRGDRGAGFLPRVLGTAQTDRNLQHAFEEALHDQPRHAAHDREIRNQRRQLRPELIRVFVGQRREGIVPQADTGDDGPVLGDVRGHRRQFRHLMPAGSPMAWRAASGARSGGTPPARDR